MRSVTGIKRALPEEQRLEFEMAYWSLKQWSKDEQEFRDLVHRKNAAELTALAEEKFQAHKSEGDPRLADYESWDSMVAKFNKERMSYGRNR